MIIHHDYKHLVLVLVLYFYPAKPTRDQLGGSRPLRHGNFKVWTKVKWYMSNFQSLKQASNELILE